MQRIFEAFDEDRDGYLSASELRSFAFRCGVTMSQRAAEELARLIDPDHDTKVQFDRLYEW
jgi:Ca2+-binding EF-hand superfamily protein